jgi:hypothetical protein
MLINVGEKGEAKKNIFWFWVKNVPDKLWPFPGRVVMVAEFKMRSQEHVDLLGLVTVYIELMVTLKLGKTWISTELLQINLFIFE